MSEWARQQTIEAHPHVAGKAQRVRVRAMVFDLSDGERDPTP